MSVFKQLVNRGCAVMREWNSYENLDGSSERMIAEIAAATLMNLCGEDMKKWTLEEQKDRANALRIALRSSFQIGKNTAPNPPNPNRKKRKRKA